MSVGTKLVEDERWWAFEATDGSDAPDYFPADSLTPDQQDAVRRFQESQRARRGARRTR